MDEYKLSTGIAETFFVTTKEDFEEQTGKDRRYEYVGNDGEKRGLAVCPFCDNPVRILGLYKKLDRQKPHARHHNGSTEFASYNPAAYYHCPEAAPDESFPSDMSSKTREATEYEIEMYRSMREYFDKVIYLLNQDLSIHINAALAKRLLTEFVENKGYMNPDASLYNLPWILLDSSFSFNLVYQKVKRGTLLHKYLSSRSDVRLDPGKEGAKYDTVVPKDKKYVRLSGHFIQHTRKTSPEGLVENIGFGLSDSDKMPIEWVYREVYDINQHRFPNLCRKGENLYRNEKLLSIAKEIMTAYL